MHTFLVSPLAYWASLSMLASGLAFILFIEIYDRIWKIDITVFTAGWRGILPSVFLVGICLSAFICAVSVLFSVWF